MLPPSDADVVRYGAERGTCPACGSGDVSHLVIGLLSGPPSPDVPDWVAFVGCCHPGYDRECGACGLRWTDRMPSTGGARR